MAIKHMPYNANKLKSTISRSNMFGELLISKESGETGETGALFELLMIGYMPYLSIKQLRSLFRAIFA